MSMVSIRCSQPTRIWEGGRYAEWYRSYDITSKSEGKEFENHGNSRLVVTTVKPLQHFSHKENEELTTATRLRLSYLMGKF